MEEGEEGEGGERRMKKEKSGEDGEGKERRRWGKRGSEYRRVGGRVVDGRIVRNIMTFDHIFAISLHHYDMPYSQAASPKL